MPAFTNAVHYIDINLDVHNSEAALTFGYNEETVTGLSLNEDSLVVSVHERNRTGVVVLTIYDVLGREVRTLVNTQQVAGSHTVVWDGRNNAGIPILSGTYVSFLQSENRVVSGRLSLIK